MSDTAQTTNNANAPGTFPTPNKNLPSLQEIISASDDTRNARAADPLNAGIPGSSAITQDDGVLEVEIGGTGTILIGGFLADADYNPEMAGLERIQIYDKMKRGDATVALALNAVKYPIFSTNWYIKPGKGEDDNGQKTTFIRQELFKNPNFTFQNVMTQAFLFCEYGNMFLEKVWRRRADDKIGWRGLKPRLPKTVFRYTLDDGKTAGITQILPTGGKVEIPDWKLLSFILGMEGSNYEGQSMLRAMHKHWFFKDLYYKIDSLAAERQGMGIPVVVCPPVSTPEDKKRAKAIAKNMRANALAYLNLPEGYSIEFLDMKAKGVKDCEPMIMHHDRQILKAVGAHFLDTGGQRGVGSQASSDNQTDHFFVAEDYYASVFQNPMQLAINELCDLNFSNLRQDEYPQLIHGNIGKIDIVKLGTGVKSFIDSGVILPDDDLDRHIRQILDLPQAMGNSADSETDWKARLQIPQIDPNDPNQVKQVKPERTIVPSGKKPMVHAENQNKFIFTEVDFYNMQQELEEAILKHHDN